MSGGPPSSNLHDQRERVFSFALERQRNSPDVEANRLLFATALGTRS